MNRKLWRETLAGAAGSAPTSLALGRRSENPSQLEEEGQLVGAERSVLVGEAQLIVLPAVWFASAGWGMREYCVASDPVERATNPSSSPLWRFMSAIACPTLACRGVGAVIVLAVCSVLMACGADADEPSLTAGQAAELQRSVTVARGGAEQGDGGAVRAALDRFRRDVRRLAADGALSEDRAQALLASAEQAQRRIEVDVAPVASPGDVPADGRGEEHDEERLEEDKEQKEKEEKEEKDDDPEEGEDGD